MQFRKACLTTLLSWNGSTNHKLLYYYQHSKVTIPTILIATLTTTSSSLSSMTSIHNYLDRTNQYLQQQNQNQRDTNSPILPTSRAGLDPKDNRFHQPIVYHPNYSFKSWPTNHTFPMSKFYHTAQCLLQKQSHLPRPLVRSNQDFFYPLNVNTIPYNWISKPTGPIDEQFLESFLSSSLTYEQQRIIGFRELCTYPELISRTLLEVSGTILASHLAYSYGVATNVAGGTHHATTSMGRGYTILNDLAIGAKYVMDERLNCGLISDVDRVLVIDCDVHQGDGTASFENLFDNDGYGDVDDDGERKGKKEFFTLSIHCESNYPKQKAKSTYDIGLPDDLGDDEYFEILVDSVNLAIEEKRPDFVFYDAGVDVFEHDVLGRLKLTENGIRKRDRWVIERCVSEGIPIVGVIGGGYDKDVTALARRHAIVHEEAAYVWRKYNLWTKAKS